MNQSPIADIIEGSLLNFLSGDGAHL